MATNKFLENLRETVKPKEEAKPPTEDDSVESPAGDGRDSRHQVLAVQLVQLTRNARAVLYGSIVGTIDFSPSVGVSFSFEGKDGVESVLITGRLLDRVYDRLCSGKREICRVNGDSITAITFTKADEA
ncbi:hypothetical protein [Zavarzinella formosa]|uniref:hypothetical protein n=1 Tax=Zavarzinella formosa TaxID=360055 RepID=UPI000304EB8E|nr:hypothetical protein [Zavarzinella formosa]